MQVVILRGSEQRALAQRLVASAPVDAVVTVKAATRSTDQNSKMWAMLSDVSRAKPEGRHWTPDVWKAGFMHALGHEILWQPGLDGQTPFPAGFRTSRLNKGQMADLITLIYEYGDRHGVRWTEPVPESLA